MVKVSILKKMAEYSPKPGTSLLGAFLPGHSSQVLF